MLFPGWGYTDDRFIVAQATENCLGDAEKEGRVLWEKCSRRPGGAEAEEDVGQEPVAVKLGKGSRSEGAGTRGLAPSGLGPVVSSELVMRGLDTVF